MGDDGELHRVLQRQLAREGLAADGVPTDPAAWRRFLGRVHRAYRDADEERYTTERSIDLSARETSELHGRVRAERDKLHAVLSALSVAVVEVDPADRVVYANGAAAAAGVPPAGQSLWEGVTLLDAHGEVVPPDVVAGTADGGVQLGRRSFPASWAVATLADPGSRLVTFTDLSDRQRIQQELTEARVDAEVARRSERTRASFLANVSHELRTPLNAIIGYAELVRDEHPVAAGPDLDRILASARHLLRLIDEVLDLARIDAGRTQLHLEEVDLGRLLEEVADTTRPLAARNGTAVRVEASAVGTVHSDLTRVRQCLLNLSSNAARFTRGGEVVLGGVRRERAVDLWVRDDGPGIAPDFVPRLFRAFTQADSGVVRPSAGTGLGLAITRAFVEELGGGVSVQTAVGVGSTFTLRLPLHPELQAEAPSAGERVERGPATADVVLVVDDDPVVVEQVAAALVGEGVQVVGVHTAEHALHEVRAGRVRAMVIDVHLPGANGWSLLSAVRADPHTATVPVAVITAGDEVRATVERLRADAFVQKPLERQRLRDCLRGLLRRSAAGA